MDPRAKLIKIFRDFHGGYADEDTSELAMIVDLLEELIDKAEVQEEHSHTLT